MEGHQNCLEARVFSEDRHDVNFQLQRRKKKADVSRILLPDDGNRFQGEIRNQRGNTIDGIADEVNKIVLYGARSISDLKRKLDVYEMMKNKVKHSKMDDRKKKFVRAESDNRPIDKRCYICGSFNRGMPG